MSPQEKKELELPMVEDASLSQMYEGTEKRHFLEPLIVLAKHKRFMIFTTGGAAIFSVVLSLLLPVYYTANTKILPPQQSGSMATAMMERGLAHVLATDLHRPRGAEAWLRAAFAAIEERYGRAMLNRGGADNPHRILAGAPPEEIVALRP